MTKGMCRDRRRLGGLAGRPTRVHFALHGPVVANGQRVLSGGIGSLHTALEWAEPLDIDFDRAVHLIGLLGMDYPLSDDELAEAEVLLEELLLLVQSLR